MPPPSRSRLRAIAATGMVTVLLIAAVLVVRGVREGNRIELTGYFDNSNGLFVGDDVRILGVNVGKITRIEPQPDQVKIDFWVHERYPVPADAAAAIISPAVVSARAIQLTPAYTGGPAMASGTVIPRDHTVVPVEWDDFREQLQTLSDTLQPTEPGGTSTLGALVSTTADNLRGQGGSIRDALIKLSTTFSTLGDHSNDISTTVKNLAVLVSALRGSTDLMRELNVNLAAVTALLVDDPTEVSTAVADVRVAIADVKDFATQHREGLGTMNDKLASITTALAESIPDIKESLHVVPNSLQNLANAYAPAQGSLVTELAFPFFQNPIAFICGAVQAASRLGAEHASKLCVQYLAPIVKNRQFNFPPIGMSLPVAAATARPNELTYSENWMRPDHNPAAAAPAPVSVPPPPAAPAGPSALGGDALPAEAPVATDPALGLPGLMVPAGTP
ncbi:MCE family protein [Mycolicibacterium sp.]